jgi:glycosyltransferase involved in cell wall biosynthesis
MKPFKKETRMISYIVIGRNEGWKLEGCFKSIQKSMQLNNYIKSEVIYVDSASTDHSIEIARNYEFVNIYRLTSDYNAPIARNLGAEMAKGDILFFIDGDMEIEPEFLGHVINREGGICYGFLGGYYIGKYYDENWNFLYEKQFPPPQKLRKEYFEAFTGGLFIIRKQWWDEVNGMKPYMIGGEDPELAIRLARRNMFKLWLNIPMAVHHTQKGPEQTTNIRYLFKKRSLRGRILQFRENIFSKYAVKRMLRTEYTALYLFIALIPFLFSSICRPHCPYFPIYC